MVTGVVQPVLDVRRWILNVTLHNPGIERGLAEPGARVSGPVVPVGDLPVGQQLAPTSRVQMIGCPSNQGSANVITGEARISIVMLGLDRRTDHEGWIAHDQVIRFVSRLVRIDHRDGC